MLDEHTVAFPNYDGNGMYLSAGNMLVNPHVGLLFIDFERGHRMRLDGTASIDLDDPLLGELPGGPVRRAGARATRSSRTARATSTATRWCGARGSCPHRLPDAGAGVEALEWAVDALPEDDPAREPGEREVLGR